MKKVMLITVAAVLSSTLGASATPGSPTVITLNGMLDTFTIFNQGNYFAQTHVRGMDHSFGVGSSATTPAIYNGVTLSDFGNNGSYQAFYNFQYPFRTGGRWSAYATVDGRRVVTIGSGTYTVNNGSGQ